MSVPVLASSGAVQLAPAISTPPAPGAKTVTSVAAELFAGAVRLPRRHQMVVYNDGATTVFWGGANVTIATGFPLMPGDSVSFGFLLTEAVPIFFVAAANVAVRVVELA